MRFILVFLILAVANSAWAVPIEWPVSEGGNGHFYEFVPSSDGISIDWWDGNQEAMQRNHEGFNGHLATITSQEEYDWIIENIFINGVQSPELMAYIGGWNELWHQREYGFEEWKWITGEPWDFTMWAPGEPNRELSALALFYLWGGNTGFNDIYFGYTWNGAEGYHPLGYLVEFDGYQVVDWPPIFVSVDATSWGSLKALYR